MYYDGFLEATTIIKLFKYNLISAAQGLIVDDALISTLYIYLRSLSSSSYVDTDDVYCLSWSPEYVRNT